MGESLTNKAIYIYAKEQNKTISNEFFFFLNFIYRFSYLVEMVSYESLKTHLFEIYACLTVCFKCDQLL
jgi:hypothetical protein